MHFNRNFSIILLFKCILLVGIASTSSAQPVKVGFHAGPNFSSHLNEFLNIENQLRLHKESTVAVNYQVGFILRKAFSPIVRLQTEPTLIRLGAHYEEALPAGEVDLSANSRTELLYLQLPLLIQFTTNPPMETVFGLGRAKTTYHLSTGIFGGYLLDARLTGANSSSSSSVDLTNDFQSFYPDYEAGVIFGFGLEHGQSQKFGIETRAILSIINADSNTELPQNMAISLSVYYIL